MRKGNVTASVLLAAMLLIGGPTLALAQAQGNDGSNNAPAATPGAPGTPDAGSTATADTSAMSDSEKQATGCAVAAAGGLAATYAAGPTEISLLWGGGLFMPTNGMILGLALLGQIGASMCAIGVIATPTVLWAADQSGNIANKLFQVSDHVGHRVMQASVDAGKTILAVLGLGDTSVRQMAASTAAPLQ